ncbi:hypothetical protein D3C83_92970 [compost metagenome]
MDATAEFGHDGGELGDLFRREVVVFGQDHGRRRFENKKAARVGRLLCKWSLEMESEFA